MLEKALAKDAAARHESARAFVAALALAVAPNVLLPESESTLGLTVSGTVASTRSNGIRRAGAFIGVLLGLAAAMWLAIRNPDTEREPGAAVEQPRTGVATASKTLTPGPPGETNDAPRVIPTPRRRDLASPGGPATSAGRPVKTAAAGAPPSNETATPQNGAGPVPAAPVSVETTGYLQLGAVPYAQVTVDGRDVGVLPMKPLLLVAGRHVVRFVHPDYQPLQRIVTVRAAETTKLFLDFGLDGIPK